MSEGPRPTIKQRHALNLIANGESDGSIITDILDIQGGPGNEAMFLLRLMDRGWVRLQITDEGREALDR